MALLNGDWPSVSARMAASRKYWSFLSIWAHYGIRNSFGIFIGRARKYLVSASTGAVDISTSSSKYLGIGERLSGYLII
jgi:hypothetical protein